MSDKKGHGCHGLGAGFALIVVLFILLIIVGAAWL
ncbi:YjcZ family sporulation protein [Heyndrickxia sp. MSNUG]